MLSINMRDGFTIAEKMVECAKEDEDYCFRKTNGTIICYIHTGDPFGDKVYDKDHILRATIAGTLCIFRINDVIYTLYSPNGSNVFLLDELCPNQRTLPYTFCHHKIISKHGDSTLCDRAKFYIYHKDDRIIVRYLSGKCINYAFVSTICFDSEFNEKFRINQVYDIYNKIGAELDTTGDVWKYNLLNNKYTINPNTPNINNKAIEDEAASFVIGMIQLNFFNYGMYSNFSVECQTIFKDIISTYAPKVDPQMIENRRGAQIKVHPETTVNIPPKESHFVPAKPIINNEERKDVMGCCICFEPIKDRTALIPCMHASYCLECANKLNKCAICNTPISSKSRIYL